MLRRTSLVVMRACQKVLPASVLLMRSRTVVRGSASRKLSTAEDKATRDVGTVNTSNLDALGLQNDGQSLSSCNAKRLGRDEHSELRQA